MTRFLARRGLRGVHLHSAALGSIVLCVTLWAKCSGLDADERENAQRRALFVGLWPPMMWLIGDSLDAVASERRRRWRR